MEHEKPTGPQIVRETLRAVGANPGGVSINPIQWIKTNPKSVLKQIGGLIIGFLLMVKVHWLFFIVFIGFLLWNILSWFNLRTVFKVGHLGPGKVIYLNPDRIAVATDMSKGFGNFPIIKIIELNLLKEDKVLNKIIPTISGYNNNPHGYPFWSEVHPVPVNHGVSNKDKVNAYMNTFDDSEIALIDERLSQIHNVKEPETYKVDIETSDWKDYNNVAIGSLSKMRGPKDFEKFESEKATMKIEKNQVWSYYTREIEKKSTVQVFQVDDSKNGTIVHVSIRNVHFVNGTNNPSTIHHVPMDIDAFKNSLVKQVGVKPIKSDSLDGYNTWKETYDNGKGGVFTISLSEVVETIDSSMGNTPS